MIPDIFQLMNTEKHYWESTTIKQTKSDTMKHDITIEERYFSEDIRSLKNYDKEFEKAYENEDSNYVMTIRLSKLNELCPRKTQCKQLYQRLIAFLNEKGITLRIISRKKVKIPGVVGIDSERLNEMKA